MQILFGFYNIGWKIGSGIRLVILEVRFVKLGSKTCEIESGINWSKCFKMLVRL